MILTTQIRGPKRNAKSTAPGRQLIRPGAFFGCKIMLNSVAGCLDTINMGVTIDSRTVIKSDWSHLNIHKSILLNDGVGCQRCRLAPHLEQLL